jgi:hypothetical protein
MKINMYEWDLTHQEFADWVIDTKAECYGVATVGNFVGPEYVFENETDFLAFTIKFKKKQPPTGMDAGYFYCPYIPLQIYTPPINEIKTD